MQTVSLSYGLNYLCRPDFVADSLQGFTPTSVQTFGPAAEI